MATFLPKKIPILLPSSYFRAHTHTHVLKKKRKKWIGKKLDIFFPLYSNGGQNFFLLKLQLSTLSLRLYDSEGRKRSKKPRGEMCLDLLLLHIRPFTCWAKEKQAQFFSHLVSLFTKKTFFLICVRFIRFVKRKKQPHYDEIQTETYTCTSVSFFLKSTLPPPLPLACSRSMRPLGFPYCGGLVPLGYCTRAQSASQFWPPGVAESRIWTHVGRDLVSTANECSYHYATLLRCGVYFYTHIASKLDASIYLSHL